MFRATLTKAQRLPELQSKIRRVCEEESGMLCRWPLSERCRHEVQSGFIVAGRGTRME